MKNVLILFLALALTLVLAACGTGGSPAQEPAEPSAPAEPASAPAESTPEAASAEPTPEPTPAPTVEDWYGWFRGMTLRLGLASDGSYAMSLAGEERSGTWEEKDGLIVLDGDEASAFLPVGDKLNWLPAGLYLSREAPERDGIYTPAELRADAPAEDFDGYWTSRYVNSGGTVLPSETVGDRTDVYIRTSAPEASLPAEKQEKPTAQAESAAEPRNTEAAESEEGGTEPWLEEANDEYRKALLSGENATARVALGGALFGDVIVDMVLTDGALRWADTNAAVTLQLQEDGLLRMTVAGGGDMTLYLGPDFAPAVG